MLCVTHYKTMTDIKITYETLFDLLRRERNREELQPLDQTFYQDVLAYLHEKRSLTLQDTHTAAMEKARIQFQNIKKILKELYDRREKKLVLLALNTVRIGAEVTDKNALLKEEQRLFDDLIATFSQHRKEILDTVLTSTDAPPPKQPPPAQEPASTSAEEVAVTFTKAVPRFAGADEHVFGPFKAGEQATLPEKIARVLIKKGRAEER
ncbi:DNA replication complex GINS family protein [Candidatus Woesearchaeota archaeon]|nr:DNA replication complex GINS family protein [Candidatus Woesearchaeota archaeon]